MNALNALIAKVQETTIANHAARAAVAGDTTVNLAALFKKHEAEQTGSVTINGAVIGCKGTFAMQAGSAPHARLTWTINGKRAKFADVQKAAQPAFGIREQRNIAAALGLA